VLGSFLGTAQGQDGVVAGRVLDADGNPAADVQVAIAPLDSDGRVAFLGRPVRTGWADEDGMFRIEAVPPGRYGVAANPDDAPTYFPGPHDAPMAAVINVDPDAVTAGIDFALSSDPPTLWAGTGPLFSGEPRPGPPVLSVPGRIVIEGADAQSHGNGRLELFFSDGFRSRTGTVVFPFGSTGGFSTDLTVRGAGRGIFWYANSVVPIPWDGIDTFQFPLPQGDYRVAPAGQPAIPGLYVKSLSYGDADLARERMVLRSNRIDEFVITLAVCPADDDSPCN
jgi:hypothetical protein